MRTKKHYKWTLVIDDQIVKVQSKTYLGAVFKALKKLKLPKREYSRRRLYNFLNTKIVQYEYSFPGVNILDKSYN